MRKYLFFCLYFISGIAFAQQPQLLQERNYKTDSFEKQLLSSAQDRNGNIFYSGLTLVNTRNFTSSFLLVKPNTDTLWSRKGPTNLNPGILAMRHTTDGGFIFCGASKHPSIGNISGLYMQKLSAVGCPSGRKTIISIILEMHQLPS
ncbi:hypothetical protein I5M27_10420 [Adhaeribacter sp. BT258]|uniref:Uncharacterized protein n=1 Tax=Adhaeribacter terrigena TaxID=2793070 RepID=A0ABS1C2N1_9BACT|nr:hypothetical protein [Adhaeribacter terrigena]MBK0403401.1 hypothetical protein [Adhaeribacter terrigena]